MCLSTLLTWHHFKYHKCKYRKCVVSDLHLIILFYIWILECLNIVLSWTFQGAIGILSRSMNKIITRNCLASFWKQILAFETESDLSYSLPSKSPFYSKNFNKVKSCNKKKEFLMYGFVEHPVNFLSIAFDYYIKKFKSIHWVSAKLGVDVADWSLIK